MKAKKVQKLFTVAELFCGCGGFSHGFWSTGKFRIVLGNDVKKSALRTFEMNHNRDGQAPIALQSDIRTVADRDIADMLHSKEIQ